MGLNSQDATQSPQTRTLTCRSHYQSAGVSGPDEGTSHEYTSTPWNAGPLPDWLFEPMVDQLGA